MIRIKVDGATLFQGELKDWESKPPDSLKDMIRPGYKPEPWAKAMMITMADAVILGGDFRITINTTPRGWTMKVSN